MSKSNIQLNIMKCGKLQFGIWEKSHHILGWLRYLPEKSIKCFEKIDDKYLSFCKENEDYYNKVIKPAIQDKEFVKEMMNDSYVKERRLFYLNKEKEEIQSIIQKAYQHNQEMKEKFLSPTESLSWLRLSLMEFWDLPELEKKLGKISFEMDLIKYGDKILEGKITEEMIERAREHPLEDLIETNQKGFALCPFHKDKHPSLYCKNNFYYCFSCGATGDVIDFVMKTQNLSFVAAVRKLC